MKVHELLAKPENWTQKKMAADKAGRQIDLLINSEQAVSYCLVGALYVCYPDLSERQQKIARIKQRLGTNNVAAWNDAAECTFTDVQAVVKSLDI